jgi:voltage-gated potassium channel
MPKTDPEDPRGPFRRRLHEIVFEADTAAGKFFDLCLFVAIVGSVLVVMLESMAGVRAAHGPVLRTLEWVFTGLFTVEYALRLASVRNPWRYATSFFGIIDLLAILPSYLSLLIPGAQHLLVVRILRLLRIFRVLKLADYLSESNLLWQAMRASRRKITVFLFTVVTIVVVVGTAMYVIEGDQHGFTSIPLGIYWAVVTLTTVGYGDLAPATVAGRCLAVVVMLLGYAIIAVPTGIVTMELSRAVHPLSTQSCPGCTAQGHEVDAVYCRHCGTHL